MGGSKPTKDSLNTSASTVVVPENSRSEEKLCCYQCYKQFFASNVAHAPNGGSKPFCSEACAQRWEEAFSAKTEMTRKRQEQLTKFEKLQHVLEVESPP